MKTRRLVFVSFLIVTLFMLTGWRGHHHKKHRPTAPIAVEKSAPKTLDLSLPLQIRDKDKFDAPITQMKIEKPKKIQREIELDTQAIMSIEPEQGKIKSFDGAGLSINIKR